MDIIEKLENLRADIARVGCTSVDTKALRGHFMDFVEMLMSVAAGKSEPPKPAPKQARPARRK